jgi:hypothetical protein
LMFYASVTDLSQMRKSLNVLPVSERGAADLLVYPEPDPASATWAGVTLDAGLPYVALSQTALDCNGGSGRMPSEGAAVLEYMKNNEPTWQVPSLAAWNARAVSAKSSGRSSMEA